MTFDDTMTAAEIERVFACEIEIDQDTRMVRAIQRGARRGVFGLTMWLPTLAAVLEDLQKGRAK